MATDIYYVFTIKQMSGIGLMKKYKVTDARQDVYNYFSSSNKENSAGLGKALYFLSEIDDKAQYAADVANIALHIILKSSLESSRVISGIVRRMKAFEDQNVKAILAVIQSIEKVGN